MQSSEGRNLGMPLRNVARLNRYGYSYRYDGGGWVGRLARFEVSAAAGTAPTWALAVDFRRGGEPMVFAGATFRLPLGFFAFSSDRRNSAAALSALFTIGLFAAGKAIRVQPRLPHAPAKAEKMAPCAAIIARWCAGVRRTIAHFEPGGPKDAKIFPPIRKSGCPMWPASSAPGAAKASLRNSFSVIGEQKKGVFNPLF